MTSMCATTMTTTTTARGYAMPMVLVVLMLLAVAVGSLATILEATIAEDRKTTSTIRTDLACGSALDLAARVVDEELRKDPSLSPADLVAKLCSRGACTTQGSERLPDYLAPAGAKLVHFAIDLESPRARTTRTIPDGAFADRVAVEQLLRVSVEIEDTLTGRHCVSIDRSILPSLPLTSFAMFGTAPRTTWKPPLSVRRLNDGAPSRIHVNGNTTGVQLSSSDFVLPSPQFAGDPLPIDLPRSTRGTDRVLAPSVGTPITSAKQAGLPRTLRWLVDPPRIGDDDALKKARLADIADVVIIDGVWYDHRDKNAPWPGTPIWSDRGGVNVGHVAPATSVVVNTARIGQGDLGFAAGTVPKLYSWYDRATPTSTIDTQNSGGVLSYGALHVAGSAQSCVVDDDCAAGFQCFRPSTSTGTCQRVEPGLWPSPALGCGSDFKGVSDCAGTDAIVDAARGGFRDGNRNVWPVNINLEMLAAALSSTSTGELGAKLGGPSFFNGVVWIGARFAGTSLPEPEHELIGTGPPPFCATTILGPGPCPPAANNATQRPRANNTVPVGLCGLEPLSSSFLIADCATAGRPNAVRVFNGGRIPAGVFPHGLTIATDLPLYVYGDLNRVQSSSPTHVKVAVVADRVTFLSRGWRDANHPWNDTPTSTPTPPATGQMIVEASIVSGMPRHGGDTHDMGDLLRTPQAFANNHFILRGHLIAGFNAEYDDRDDGGDRVGAGLRWLSDYHLENPGFQPPGMPLLTLPPSARWRQRP